MTRPSCLGDSSRKHLQTGTATRSLTLGGYWVSLPVSLPLLLLLRWMKAVWQTSQPSPALIDEVRCSVANACEQLILKY